MNKTSQDGGALGLSTIDENESAIAELSPAIICATAGPLRLRIPSRGDWMTSRLAPALLLRRAFKSTVRRTAAAASEKNRELMSLGQ
jgi:hypothetical protein